MFVYMIEKSFSPTLKCGSKYHSLAFLFHMIEATMDGTIYWTILIANFFPFDPLAVTMLNTPPP